MKKNKTLFLFITCFTIAGIANAQNQAQKDRLRADISYLANDALEGRLAGSEGEKKAADYILDQFHKAGLKPWHGTEKQPFDIIKLRLALDNSKLAMVEGERELPSFKLHKDFCILSQSKENDSVTAEAIYLGFGIEDDTLMQNDYKSMGDLRGKIFLIRNGHPESGTNPHSKLEIWDINRKIETAVKHGAVGIIFLDGGKNVTAPDCEMKRNTQPSSIPVFYFKHPDMPMHPGAKIKMYSSVLVMKNTANNLFGYRNNKKKNTVIICAHYDHLGYNELGGSLYKGNGAIHNGADDNASGVAAMMELARELKGKKYKKNNYLFIAFSAEELGLIGSKKFVSDNKLFDSSQTNYVINIDMLGRLDSTSKTLIINGVGTTPNWTSTLSKIVTDSNQIKIKTTESGVGASDHTSFYLENIPVLHFFSGQHSDYHKPSDDEEKINYQGMVLCLDVIEQFVAKNNKAGKLKFTKTKDAQGLKSPWKVSMGIMPDYAFSGTGVRIDGTTEGKPAAKAGLLKGDVIVSLCGYSTPDVEGYTEVLRKLENGQTCEVVIKRNGVEQKVKVEF